MMFLEKIVLKNFKSYKSLEFECNSSFNMIIGENNVGKSTLFDALLLWKLAYSKLIQANKKDFYKKDRTNSMNINFTQFLPFRLVDADDLFLDPWKKEASIQLTVNDNEGAKYDLEIKLRKPEIKNSYLRFTNADKLDEFIRFATHCRTKTINLHNAIQIQITKPISIIIKEEPFYNKAQIEKKSLLGFSIEVLRNKILLTIENKRFEYLEKRLKNIFEQDFKIRFKNTNREEDEFLKITIEKNEKEVDLLLVGSGILSTLEIFSTIYNKDRAENNSLNLLLFDEPDSHIHSDIQMKLIDAIKAEEHVQPFVITHNDRLMEKADNEQLFFINESVKVSGLLKPSELCEYQFIKNCLSSYLTNINRNIEKTLIITEGKTDWKHFKRALDFFKLNGEFTQLDINFLEYEDELEMGDSKLETLLKESSKVPRTNKLIGIFDCDTKIGKKYEDSKNQIINDSVFAVSIPTPNFRSYHDGICVEFLYLDSDLKKVNEDGRRIYLSEEFTENGRLKEDKTIVIENANKIKRKTSRENSMIVDSGITDIDEKSLAMSKNDFALSIYNKKSGFEDLDFEGFRGLFEIIDDIEKK